MKAGSLNSVISAADAKKMGLIKTTTVEPKDKSSKATGTKDPKEAKDKKDPVVAKVPGKENQDSENNKKPITAKTSFKAAGTAATIVGSKKKGADEEDDPIALSLAER